MPKLSCNFVSVSKSSEEEKINEFDKNNCVNCILIIIVFSRLESRSKRNIL